VARSGITGAGIGAIAGAPVGGILAALSETNLTTDESNNYDAI
jgi:hypothetical protein